MPIAGVPFSLNRVVADRCGNPANVVHLFADLQYHLQQVQRSLSELTALFGPSEAPPPVPRVPEFPPGGGASSHDKGSL